MPFYVYSKGSFHLYAFDYLEKQSEDARLEKTVVSSRSAEVTEGSPNKSKGPYVVEVMKRKVFEISPETLLSEVAEIFTQHSIHHLPVVKREGENFQLCGMVSDRDFIKLKGGRVFENSQVHEIMSSLLVVVGEETPIGQVAQVFLNEQIHALPVINEDEQLTGIITAHDLLNVLAHHTRYFST